MNEKQTSFLDARWVILLPAKEADEFEETDFKVIYKADNLFSTEYKMLLIESLTIYGGEYTAEDVLSATGALAVHEEFTNGVVTLPDTLDEIADELYPWNDGGNVFIGDMLTDAERLSLIIKYYWEKHKIQIDVEDLDIVMTKDSDKVLPMTDNIDKLFCEEPHSVLYKGEDPLLLWFAELVRDKGFFIVCIDDDLEDDDDEENLLLPAPRKPLQKFDDYDDYLEEVYGGNYPWGSAYDDYDYDDRYYRRT